MIQNPKQNISKLNPPVNNKKDNNTIGWIDYTNRSKEKHLMIILTDAEMHSVKFNIYHKKNWLN